MSSVLAEIQHQIDPSWPVSIGWPRAWGEWLAQRIGLRLYWTEAPDNLKHSLASIVTSQSARSLASQPEWLARFQDALRSVGARGLRLLRNQVTPTGPAQSHAAQTIGLPALDLVLPDRNETIKTWIARRKEELAHQPISQSRPRGATRLWVSPPLTPPEEECFRTPLIDQLLAWLPDQLYVVELRQGGKTFPLIQQRLASKEYPQPSVYVELVAEAHEHNALACELMDLGGIGRWVTHSRCATILHDPVIRELFGERSTLAPIGKLNQFTRSASWQWLSHCTRSAIVRPSERNFAGCTGIDLLGEGLFEIGALGTLIRILSQKRLVATSYLKRGAHPTVSFSATPLPELLARRMYQPHLGRWDWEPFGVCIRWQALERLGARAVHYGSSEEFELMPEEDRPYFQIRQTKTGRDWTEEQEWRLLGDCRLNPLAFHEAFVFVPSLAEARQVAHLSNWPIVVVNESIPVASQERLM